MNVKWLSEICVLKYRAVKQIEVFVFKIVFSMNIHEYSLSYFVSQKWCCEDIQGHGGKTPRMLGDKLKDMSFWLGFISGCLQVIYI